MYTRIHISSRDRTLNVYCNEKNMFPFLNLFFSQHFGDFLKIYHYRTRSLQKKPKEMTNSFNTFVTNRVILCKWR